MPTFSADRLVPFAAALFRAARVPADEADRGARSLVDANLAGHDSHGLIRVAQYIKAIEDGLSKPGTPLTVLNQTAGALVCDGGWGLGHVQAHRLLQRLVHMARSGGVAAGTTRNAKPVCAAAPSASRWTMAPGARSPSWPGG